MAVLRESLDAPAVAASCQLGFSKQSSVPAPLWRQLYRSCIIDRCDSGGSGPCPNSTFIDIKTIHPDQAVCTLQLACNRLRADLLGHGGNEEPNPYKDQACLDLQEALRLVQH